jgi:hypothetical protein
MRIEKVRGENPEKLLASEFSSSNRGKNLDQTRGAMPLYPGNWSAAE